MTSASSPHSPFSKPVALRFVITVPYNGNPARAQTPSREASAHPYSESSKATSDISSNRQKELPRADKHGLEATFSLSIAPPGQKPNPLFRGITLGRPFPLTHPCSSFPPLVLSHFQEGLGDQEWLAQGGDHVNTESSTYIIHVSSLLSVSS